MVEVGALTAGQAAKMIVDEGVTDEAWSVVAGLDPRARSTGAAGGTSSPVPANKLVVTSLGLV